MHLPLLEIIQMEGYFREPSPRLKIDQSQGLTSGTKIRASFPVPKSEPHFRYQNQSLISGTRMLANTSTVVLHNRNEKSGQNNKKTAEFGIQFFYILWEEMLIVVR